VSTGCVQHRCKNVFYFFYSCRVFNVFNVFYFPYVFKNTNIENLFSVQANSEISVLHLINDRPNCSGLVLFSTFFGSCCAYYEDRHLSLSLRRKITVNVFYSTFTDVFFTFVTFFLHFKTFGERFFIYDVQR